MLRVWMFVFALAMIFAQLADRIFLRSLTAQKDVKAVSVNDGRIYVLPLETQEIVNNESVVIFSKDAIVKMLNYRPGRANEHVESEGIKSLFINDIYHERFKEQFLSWSNYEFNVNNISIKEAVATSGDLIKTPPASIDGARIWRYTATVPVVDRGVGGTVPSKLFVTLSLVYLGPEGGMGIYSVNIKI